MGLQGVKQRVTDWADRARERSTLLDHGVRTVQYYDDVLGSPLAAAVTYYGFLSFFPIVALAFAAVGYVVEYVPGADETVTEALESIFPGIVGTESHQVNVEAIASRKASVGIVGLLVLLYSGLGWVSALRTALQAVFEVVSEKTRNLFVGKAFDLLVLGVVGVMLVAAVALTTAVTGFTDAVVEWLGLSNVPGMRWVLLGAVLLVGTLANTVLFVAIYRLLPKHHAPMRVVVEGALIAAVGFEVLKQLAGVVIGSVTGNPLYGAFAIMVALLVWMNYFARLVILGAAWAVTRARMRSAETPSEPDGKAASERALAP